MRTGKTAFIAILLLLTLVFVTACSGKDSKKYEAFDVIPVPEKEFTVQHDGTEYVLKTGDITLSFEKKADDYYIVSVEGTAGKMERSDVDVLYSPESPITHIICVLMKLPDGATVEDCDLLNIKNESIGVTQEDFYTNDSGTWIWLTLGMYDADGTTTMNSSKTTMVCGDRSVTYEYHLDGLKLD